MTLKPSGIRAVNQTSQQDHCDDLSEWTGSDTVATPPQVLLGHCTHGDCVPKEVRFRSVHLKCPWTYAELGQSSAQRYDVTTL